MMSTLCWYCKDCRSFTGTCVKLMSRNVLEMLITGMIYTRFTSYLCSLITLYVMSQLFCQISINCRYFANILINLMPQHVPDMLLMA